MRSARCALPAYHRQGVHRVHCHLRSVRPFDGGGGGPAPTAQLAKTFPTDRIRLGVAVSPTLPGNDLNVVSPVLEAESEVYRADGLDPLQSNELHVRPVIRTRKAAEAMMTQALQRRVSVGRYGHRGVGP